MITEIAEGIYTFEIVLPENPLKWLNCYVIKGKNGGRNLLIDSGFRRKECTEALKAGMEELELKPEETDVLFTHLHADHTGNANYLQSIGCRLFMGQTDYEFAFNDSPSLWEDRARLFAIPKDILGRIMVCNPALIYAPSKFDVTYIHDGELLHYGGRELECLLTPGHTLGHFCLYDRKNKLIFTGDHVLFDITPNIVASYGSVDSLGIYLKNLRKLRCLDIETALPAHRTTGDKSIYQRIDELIAHHEERLREVYNAVKAHPDSTAYDIAQHVTWRIKAADWDSFPDSQKWFAVSECMAHVYHLYEIGYFSSRNDESGAIHFSVKKEASFGEAPLFTL